MNKVDTMQDRPSIFDAPDAAAEARADEETEADIAAGRMVPHERLREWLTTLAAGQYEPPPEPDGIDGPETEFCGDPGQTSARLRYGHVPRLGSKP